MIKNYFKIAWRNLIKNKEISSINIVGLATGMTAAVLILIWVQNEMNFDNFHPQSESIYRLTTKAVSYTHLRAHETRHDLVCRLLLEKKKKKYNIKTHTF